MISRFTKKIEVGPTVELVKSISNKLQKLSVEYPELEEVIDFL